MPGTTPTFLCSATSRQSAVAENVLPRNLTCLYLSDTMNIHEWCNESMIINEHYNHRKPTDETLSGNATSPCQTRCRTVSLCQPTPSVVPCRANGPAPRGATNGRALRACSRTWEWCRHRWLLDELEKNWKREHPNETKWYILLLHQKELTMSSLLRKQDLHESILPPEFATPSTRSRCAFCTLAALKILKRERRWSVWLCITMHNFLNYARPTSRIILSHFTCCRTAKCLKKIHTLLRGGPRARRSPAPSM